MGLRKLFKSKAEKQTIQDLQAEISRARLELQKSSSVLPLPASSSSVESLRRELDYLRAASAQHAAAQAAKDKLARELAILQEKTPKPAPTVEPDYQSEPLLPTPNGAMTGVLQSSKNGTSLNSSTSAASNISETYSVLGKLGLRALYALIAGALALIALREIAGLARQLLASVSRIFVSPAFVATVIFITVVGAGVFVLITHSNNGRAVVEKSIDAQQQIEVMRLGRQTQEMLAISFESSATLHLEDDRQRELAESWRQSKEKHDREVDELNRLAGEARRREQLREEIKRLEMRQKQLEETKGQISDVVKRTSSPRRRERSIPVKTWPMEYASITLFGDTYYFCGPAHDHRRLPTSLQMANFDWTRYVELGEKQSFYQHYHEDGKCWTTQNCRSAYPDLVKFLSEHEQYGCPICVSLGPSGYYFIRTEWGCSYRLSDAAQKHLGDMTHVKKLWIGKDCSYIAVKFDGSMAWNLQYHYKGLEETIKKRDGVIEYAALNPTDQASFIAIWADGYSLYKAGNSFDYFQFEEYSTKNFSANWAA